MRLVTLSALLWVGIAHAAQPTIAVMPFADLAGGNARVGEAIRETVAGDLAQLGQVRVLERARIDQVIAESNLAAKKRDLDAVAGVRLGTLLGASIIVTGAYQRAGATVRLTARMIRVETGEIFGSAKADGTVADTLRLQDQLTAQLLASAGLRAPPPRKRAPLKSWRTLELYADAVTEPDDQKKQRLLAAVVAEDPAFVYATRDLEALQQRMAEYGKAASVQLSRSEAAALAQLQSSKLAQDERARLAKRLFDEMMVARRFRSLESAAARLGANSGGALAHEAVWALFVARDRLHKFDLALQTGETYLRQFPTSAHFRDVETRMHEIAETKKTRAARRSEYDADLAEKRHDLAPTGAVPPSRQAAWDYAPCICARWNNQLNDLMLRSCTTFVERWQGRLSGDDADNLAAARFFVILALSEAGDFTRAAPLADKLMHDTDKWTPELRTLISTWPTD